MSARTAFSISAWCAGVIVLLGACAVNASDGNAIGAFFSAAAAVSCTIVAAMTWFESVPSELDELFEEES